jgi:hypothetical protein
MLYGPQKADKSICEQWRQLLLQYCKLDTLVMVLIDWHWEMGLNRESMY